MIERIRFLTGIDQAEKYNKMFAVLLQSKELSSKRPGGGARKTKDKDKFKR